MPDVNMLDVNMPDVNMSDVHMPDIHMSDSESEYVDEWWCEGEVEDDDWPDAKGVAAEIKTIVDRLADEKKADNTTPDDWEWAQFDKVLPNGSTKPNEYFQAALVDRDQARYRRKPYAPGTVDAVDTAEELFKM